MNAVDYVQLKSLFIQQRRDITHHRSRRANNYPADTAEPYYHCYYYYYYALHVNENACESPGHKTVYL